MNWTSLEAKSFVQLQTHSCLKSVKPRQDIPDRNLSVAASMPFREFKSMIFFAAVNDYEGYLTAILMVSLPILAMTIVSDTAQEATPATAEDEPMSLPSAA